MEIRGFTFWPSIYLPHFRSEDHSAPLNIEIDRQSDGQRRHKGYLAILLVEMGGSYRLKEKNDGLTMRSLVGCR